MTRPTTLLLVPTLAALAACASMPAPVTACAPGRRAMESELLYFGTASPQGAVSAADWRDFVDVVVTPRFPDGLTVWPASGQWRSADGSLVRESSWVLNVIHAPDASADAAIAAIIDAYKQRFHQESVLRATSAACVAF
jgi:hypothetical protein